MNDLCLKYLFQDREILFSRECYLILLQPFWRRIEMCLRSSKVTSVICS